MAKTNKYSPATISFFVITGLAVFFACTFSMQGFLDLGMSMATKIETWPVLGWLIDRVADIPNAKIVGFIILAFAGLQAYKSNGVGLIELIGLLIGVLLIGGVETLSNNIGSVFGFILFLWFNVVELAWLAGWLLGFQSDWGDQFAGHTAFAYIAETGINLVRFPSYGDGTLKYLLNDIQAGVVSVDSILWENLVLVLCSVVAVEFTFVFFVKFTNSVYIAMKNRRRPA